MNDSPFMGFDPVFTPYAPGDEIVFDRSIEANLFLVWVFDDGTVYPIGRRTWTLRFHWRVDYLRHENGKPIFAAPPGGDTERLAGDGVTVPSGFTRNQTSRWAAPADFVANAPAANLAASAYR